MFSTDSSRLPLQPKHILEVLPRLCHLAVPLLQQWGAAVPLPRGRGAGQPVPALRRAVSLQVQRHRPRVLPLCHRLLGLPQLQA